jgi:hypothetical protein
MSSRFSVGDRVICSLGLRGGVKCYSGIHKVIMVTEREHDQPSYLIVDESGGLSMVVSEDELFSVPRYLR